MKKERLLEMLQKGLDEEENAIPLYARHLSSTLFLSGFKPEAQVRIQELLLLLKKESEFHARVYERLMQDVRGSSQDVY